MKDQCAPGNTVDGLVKQSCGGREEGGHESVWLRSHGNTQEVTDLQLQQGQTLPLSSTQQQGHAFIFDADRSQCPQSASRHSPPSKAQM